MTASKMSAAYTRHLQLAEKACAFLTASTDPFHAVKSATTRLEAAGFSRLPNTHFANTLSPGGKYYYTVEHSTLVAFTVGEKYQAGNGGFHIIGGHTDSPNLKVKPRSKKAAKSGCVQLGVECYGGGLWHSWFDRDLSLSGKVLVRDDTTGKIHHRLVNLKDPIARVSTLCIHLQSAEERKGFSPNKEDHTSPIIATSNSVSKNSFTEGNKDLEQGAIEQINGDSWTEGQEPLLLQMVADKLEIQVSQIADFELNLYDTQAAAVGGMNKEFLYSARLDNLATVFCAVEAIAEHAADLSQDQDISLVVCFDHEEVGSNSLNGAGSPVITQAIRRISAALNNGSESSDAYATTIAKSFCLSIDQAHAHHPNYASKHESEHAPLLNCGVVIKKNSNQRYATSNVTSFLLRELAKKTDTPIQEFVGMYIFIYMYTACCMLPLCTIVLLNPLCLFSHFHFYFLFIPVRNDCPCGSTIGPTISALTGIRTIDAGMPQLSMHSCREVMGTADLSHGLDLFRGFFSHFREVDESLVQEE
jgi:aspartyl aminopeptidase